MSSGGQILGGIAGGVVGFFAGNPWLGAQIGLSLGGYLDPPKGPTVHGPTLDDLTVQTSTYGATVPRIYGTVSVVGNVFWLENNQYKPTETKKKSGGKGGAKKTTTYTTTYSATFAVALCKGPIVGIRRLWIRTDLVYDAGATDHATIVASNQSAAGWTLYTGTETQAADPRMQATLGVDNTPAWRGLAYLVFEDLELEKYGNSLLGAQVRAEVVTAGSVDKYPYTEFSGLSSYYWNRPAWDGAVYCAVAYFQHRVVVSSDGLTWQQYSIPNANGPSYQGVASDGSGTLLAYGTSATNLWRSTNHGQSWATYPLPGFSGYVTQIEYNGSYFVAITDGGPFFRSFDRGVTWVAEAAPTGGTKDRSLCWHAGSGQWYVRPVSGTGRDIYSSPTATAGSWSVAYTMPADFNNHSFCVVHRGRIIYVGFGTVGSYGPCVVYSDDGGTWQYAAAPMREGYVLSDGENCWLGDKNGAMHYSADGVTGWTAWTGPLQGVDHDAVFANGFLVALSNSGGDGYRIRAQLLSTETVLLADIVSSECLQSDLLTAGDIDVSALTSTVRGYRIGSIGTLRSALEPLQAAFPFDIVQRGYKLTFKPRGGASVATIAAGDLDARGADQEAGVQITRSREVDSQLPRRLTVRYLDSAREYDVGSQYAERLAAATIRETLVDLPIVFTAGEAAGKAEVLLYAAWLSRLQVSFNLPATYMHLEPADVVTLPTPDGSINVRLTEINYTSDGRLECRAVLEHAAIYTPVAIGVEAGTTGPTTLTPLGASTYALLDIPRLSSAQDGVGFPVAMCGGNSAWPGGVLMRSADAGATYDEPLDFAPPGATIGTASTTIPIVESRLIDAASRLTVTLTSGDLSDVSELSMFGGANHFAYGAAGRWEIIAARTCTLQAGSTYILSNMLRGRFGTEWAMGLHAVGDTLVLLDSADLQMLTQSGADIGASRLYRAITSGRDFSTDSDHAMTYAAVNLKPLSPVYLKGSRHPTTGDWAVQWTRRTRVGGEWRDGVGVELGESSEAYEVEIFASGSFTTVKRTLTVSAPALVYSSSEQGVDFGAIQDDLYLKVRQLSASVGRGYALAASLSQSSPTGYVATITVPPGSVGAALTGFPLFVDLALFSVAWWGSLYYRDGRDIRVTDSLGAAIPFDLVALDAQNRTGYMFVKTNLSNVAATAIIISVGLASNGFVPVTDPVGRNAVWSNYHRVMTFGHDHSDRTGNGYPTAYVPTTSMQLVASSPNTFSHQGVAWDGVSYYVSDTNGLTRYDQSWSVLATNSNPLAGVGGGVDHVGDIEVVDGILYAPVEVYVNPTTYSQMRIARYNAATLAYIDSVSIAAQGHEASSITYCDSDGYLYVSSYADGGKLWKYRLDTLAYVGSLSLSTTISTVQGVTWWRGAFWVNSGDARSTYRVEYDGAVRGSVYNQATGVYEGVGHTDQGLLILVDVTGAPGNGVVHALKPTGVGALGAVEMSGTVDQFEYLPGLARYTTWTMGVSVKLAAKAANAGVMSYTINGSSLAADRATIAYRLSSDRLGLWNSSDSWLLDTISPTVGTTYRINASHNGTAGRKLYRDGTLTASAGSCAERPAVGADVIVMGIESWVRNEDLDGCVGFAYLAPAQFSDHYIAAEAANLIGPATFYTISE